MAAREARWSLILPHARRTAGSASAAGRRLKRRSSDLVRAVAEQLDLTVVKAEEAVVEVLETMKATLARGEPVMWRRFGAFEGRANHAREGRHPKTGEHAEMAARRVVRFKAGKQFRAAVSGKVTSN